MAEVVLPRPRTRDDILALKRLVRLAVRAAIDNNASVVVGYARQRAPVRKLFGGKGMRRPKMRFMTEREVVEANRAYRSMQGTTLSNYRPMVAKPMGLNISPYSKAAKSYARVAVSRPRQHDEFPTLPMGGKMVRGDFRAVDSKTGRLLDTRAEAWLTYRGQQEVSRGFADFTGADGVTRVGGRLKNSITSSWANASTARIAAHVYTKVPYAKYQELGTRRHAAQPFLRPALQMVRNKHRADIIKALNKIKVPKAAGQAITNRPSKIKPQKG